MRKIFFTVGPTQIDNDYQKLYEYALNKNLFSYSHRTEEFENIFSSATNNLKKLLNISDNFYIFFLSSATECMERILQNLVFKNSFHFINGYFAKRFYDFAFMLKKEPYFIENDFKSGFEFETLDIPDDTELIALTHNETSTGVALDYDFVYNLKKHHPDKILAIDMVTSLPYYDFDYNFIDVAFFSIQKGFALPPGLGVLIIKKELINKTIELKNMNINIGTYNNFIRLAENANRNQTSITPNISAIYMLGEICKKFLKAGIENIRRDTEKKAQIIYDFFDSHTTIKPYIQNRNHRSKTTINLELNNSEFINKVITKLDYNGFIVSPGYDNFKSSQIRIGNFPVHTQEAVSELIYLFRKF